jgi:hypothetical protein
LSSALWIPSIESICKRRQDLHRRELCDGLSEKENPSADPFRIAMDEKNNKTLLDAIEYSVRVQHGVVDFYAWARGGRVLP